MACAAAGTFWLKTSPFRSAFTTLVLAFDHLLRRAYIFSSGLPETDDLSRSARAAARIDHLLALLEHPGRIANAPPAIHGWASNFTPVEYHAAIEDVQAHIFAGDIYPGQYRAAVFRQSCRRISRRSDFTRSCARPIPRLSPLISI